MARVNQPTKHIAFVGVTGVGKSTLVNVLNGAEVAKVDNNVRPCTTGNKSYEVVDGNSTYCIWDTRGLNEASEQGVFFTRLLRLFGILPDADRELKKFLRRNDPNISLVLLCVDAKKIRASVHWKIYNKIYANFGEGRLKVAIVATQMRENDFRGSNWKETCRTAARDIVEQFPDATMMEAMPEFEDLNDPIVQECKSRILRLISRAA